MGNALTYSEGSGDAWDKHGHINDPHRPPDATKDDMTQPLSHYFISSGHNSYLTGDQLVSTSGTATIVFGLKHACRVIELDVYNEQLGFKGPVCKHGGTLTKPVPFHDCIQAVADHAFEKSPYPVILTFENHADAENQKIMADILISVLGDKLYIPGPDEAGQPWKSPEQLKHKVLIRANAGKSSPELKRLIYIQNCKFKSLKEVNDSGKTTSSSFDENKAKRLLVKAMEETGIPLTDKEMSMTEELVELMSFKRAGSKKGGSSKNVKRSGSTKAANGSEGPTEAAIEDINAPADAADDEAVNTVHSLAELYAYTANNLMRVYPGGLRVDSSNPNPINAWSAGASLAALNWQVWDQPLWLNTAMTGSGKILCWKDDIYVEVEVCGMPQDNAYQRTKTHSNTGRLHVNQTYTFQITYPELAFLVIKAMDEDVPGTKTLDDMKGHWEIAVRNLVPGQYKLHLEDSRKQVRLDRWVKVSFEWVDAPRPPSGNGQALDVPKAQCVRPPSTQTAATTLPAVAKPIAG